MNLRLRMLRLVMKLRSPAVVPPRAPRKAVWVDFGGVLTPPVEETLAYFCRRLGVEPPQLAAAMLTVARAHGTDDIMEPLDTPLVTEGEWAKQVERVLCDATGWSTSMSNFGAKWFSGRPPNAELVAYLRTLRARGCFLGLLSNMVPSFEPHWRVMVPPEGLFDDLVLSYRVGVRKPERAIYELAAGRAGLAPEDCVLVDDLEQNVEGARAAGWDAVHFTGTSQAIADLDRLLGMA